MGPRRVVCGTRVGLLSARDLVEVEAHLRAATPEGVLLSGSGPTLLALHESVAEARGTAELLGPLGLRCTLAPGPVAGAHVVTYA